jgi:hypothetical protein
VEWTGGPVSLFHRQIGARGGGRAGHHGVLERADKTVAQFPALEAQGTACGGRSIAADTAPD